MDFPMRFEDRQPMRKDRAERDNMMITKEEVFILLI
jgi:hypothetical protein